MDDIYITVRSWVSVSLFIVSKGWVEKVYTGPEQVKRGKRDNEGYTGGSNGSDTCIGRFIRGT